LWQKSRETGFIHNDNNPAQSSDCAGISGQELSVRCPAPTVPIPHVMFGFKTKVISLGKGMNDNMIKKL
jgi:hypothetical protein